MAGLWFVLHRGLRGRPWETPSWASASEAGFAAASRVFVAVGPRTSKAGTALSKLPAQRGNQASAASGKNAWWLQGTPGCRGGH